MAPKLEIKKQVEIGKPPPAYIMKGANSQFSRTGISTGLTASAITINTSKPSGTMSNVAALSKNVGDVSHTFDQAIQEVIENGYVEDTLTIDLMAAMNNYSNHLLPRNLAPCGLSGEEWRQIKFAAEQASKVYSSISDSHNIVIIDASLNGNIKKTLLKKEMINGRNTLIIAVRGTMRTSIIDWAVNVDSDPEEMLEASRPVGCHRGYLYVARKMQEKISEAVKRLDSDGPPITAVLFTGHSAGGATAQLLYTLSFSSGSEVFKSLSCLEKMDCITFAAPPIATSPLLPRENSAFLSIVNEGDPIALAQQSYVDSLIRAYVTPQRSSGTKWNLPEPKYLISGKCIVLRDPDPEDYNARTYGAFTVTQEVMNEALFGLPSMHSMKEYKKRVDDLSREYE